MIEQPVDQAEENGIKKEQLKNGIIELAKELCGKVFIFPGIDQGAYSELESVDDDYPDCATPIGELVDKLKENRMRVVLAGDNVYILPLNSDDIENDSIFPRQLQVVAGMDERLAKLIVMSQEFRRTCHANS
jgi:hypothetical protein